MGTWHGPVTDRDGSDSDVAVSLMKPVATGTDVRDPSDVSATCERLCLLLALKLARLTVPPGR